MKNDSQIKEKIKERHSKIDLFGNSDSCCMPSSEEESIKSLISTAKSIGYSSSELESIPQSSILGVGCGNPI